VNPSELDVFSSLLSQIVPNISFLMGVHPGLLMDDLSHRNVGDMIVLQERETLVNLLDSTKTITNSFPRCNILETHSKILLSGLIYCVLKKMLADPPLRNVSNGFCLQRSDLRRSILSLTATVAHLC
jgi:hypothetical protein